MPPTICLSKQNAKVANGHNSAKIMSQSLKSVLITKTYPLKLHFYIVKLGFTGVYIIFFISAQKHRLWYPLEPPRRGGSNE